ncbi:hypothetical protein JOB18_024713 [Solea senegalensis]|uniref:Mitochondrial antiviral-signaling protein n=1 Tax=Solea senegalensis TaxID=28829 RepID=A0AAV6RZA9_SOLSE|nr:fibrous sheath CABYR-binding protein-like [Solea senegalensis]KAG7510547.1 hypothetical protein JOB18_024713 [Solea senegalensis]
MALASDKLYNGYLRRKMPAIVSKVKVKEVMVYLPCLTAHDRENIEAKRETYGNFDAMVLLLDCLKRRENWPEQFIEALESCEHPTIAADIQAEYDTLRGVDNPSPSSPSTTVTRAHVHPAPPAGHLSGPESPGAAVAPPAEASDPPEPAAQTSLPLEVPMLPQSPSEQQPNIPEVVSPPKPVPEPPQPSETEVAAVPSTPPPSPETPLTPADSAHKGEEVIAHQEPEENSESYFMDVPVEVNLMPEMTPPGVGLVETYSPLHPDPLKTTGTTEIKQPESPPQVNSDVTDGSSFPTLTPEKPPVQDTMPPVDKVSAPEPEETSEPPTIQDIENSTETETEAPPSPQLHDGGIDASITDDNSLCLSKPDVLISVPPPPSHNGPTLPAYNPPVEPYSGDSARGEISDPAPESVCSLSVPACSTDTSTTKDADSGLPCQENSIALNQQEPADNHLESTCQSLETMDVQEHVVHLSENVSILDGDSPNSAQAINSIISSEADRTITPSPLSPFTTITAGTESSLNAHPSPEPSPEPAPSENKPEPPTLPPAEKERHACRSNIKYTVAAAGMAALALVMAWKFKKGTFLKG